jgi:hypothetical protein
VEEIRAWKRNFGPLSPRAIFGVSFSRNVRCRTSPQGRPKCAAVGWLACGAPHTLQPRPSRRGFFFVRAAYTVCGIAQKFTLPHGITTRTFAIVVGFPSSHMVL